MLSLLGTIGLLSLATSLVMLVSQFQTGDFMNKERRKEYLLISQKQKSVRTKEEQYLIDQTWHQYYMSIIRIISFKVGLAIVPTVLLLNYLIGK